MEYAAKKLQEKNLDLIVANDVAQTDAGFDVDTNIITILYPDGRKTAYEKCKKEVAADHILNAVAALL